MKPGTEGEGPLANNKGIGALIPNALLHRWRRGRLCEALRMIPAKIHAFNIRQQKQYELAKQMRKEHTEAEEIIVAGNYEIIS